MLKLISIFLLLIIVVLYLKMRSKEVKLLPPRGDSIYFGAFPDFGGDENIISSKRIEKFEALAQKKMLWSAFSQHWFQGMKYPKNEIHTIHKMGIIPFIRLLPRSNLKEFQKENRFSLDNIIRGDFDIELQEWAEEAKKDNIPLIIDFAVEMNGDWFGWSGALNGANSDAPKKYRNAYRHIIDIFRDKEVHHITWFFHPTITSEPDEEWNAPKYYYPGDEYIDWIGISIYGPFHPAENYWETFSEKLEESYKRISEVSFQKPFAVLEFGVTDHHSLGSKSEWINNAFETILSNRYIKFQAITYWHENWDNDGILTSLRIDSSSKSLRTFQTALKNRRFISKANFSN
jgi:hypothetical protein